MPIEEVETTETEVVETTTTEKIVICDSCGVNDDTGDIQVHAFQSSSFGHDLYLCEECLGNEEITPIVGHIKEGENTEAVAIILLAFGLGNPIVLGFLYGYDGVEFGFIVNIVWFALAFVILYYAEKI